MMMVEKEYIHNIHLLDALSSLLGSAPALASKLAIPYLINGRIYFIPATAVVAALLLLRCCPDQQLQQFLNKHLNELYGMPFSWRSSLRRSVGKHIHTRVPFYFLRGHLFSNNAHVENMKVEIFDLHTAEPHSVGLRYPKPHELNNNYTSGACGWAFQVFALGAALRSS